LQVEFKKGIRKKPYHPDIAIFLILIPFISAFNYYLTYSNIHLNGFLALTFVIDTVQGYIAWWAVRSFLIMLDKKWPYEKNTARRIAFQLVCTSVIGLLVISLLTELVSWIARGRPAPLNFYAIDLFIIGVWFFVINGIYIGLYYYNEWQKSEAARLDETRSRTEGLLVRHGKQDLVLDIDDIAGCYVDDDYVVVANREGQKYYMDVSLDKIEQKLPSGFFFRLNRQFLVHRQLVTGFKRAENGKILVMLSGHTLFPSEVPVSRTKAVAFKSWFRPLP